jgi:tetratricopeptide (TPR) repeat protein
MRNANNSDSLFFYAEKFLLLKDSLAQYEGYFAKAYAFRNNMRIDSAMVNFQKAFGFATQKNEKSRAVRMSLITAVNAGDNQKALHHAEQMFRLADEYNDSLILANAYNQRGIIKKEIGELEEAIADYVKASAIYEKLNEPAIINVHTNIAIAYDILGQPNLALSWFKKAYEHAEVSNNERLLIRATNNLANHYKSLNDIKSSKAYYDELLSKEEQLNAYYLTLLYQSLSEIAIQEGNLLNAQQYLSKVEPLVLAGDNIERKIQFFSVEARYHKAQKAYAESLAELDSAIFYAEKHQLPNRLFPLYLRKAEMHKQLKAYQPAAASFERYVKLKDSLQDKQEVEVIQETLTKYEVAQKEDTIKTYLDREQDLINNLYFAGGLAVFFLIGGIFTFKRYRSTKMKHLEAEQRSKKQKSELDQLQQELQQQNLEKKIKLKNDHLIKCNELLYINSEGHYLSYYTDKRDRPLVERQKLSAAMEALNDHGFVRTHRSYIINAQKVKAVHSDTIVLEQNIEIPFSRTYKQKLKQEKHPLMSS